MSLFSELKRRNVLRVAIAYVAAGWLIIQVLETLFSVYELSNAAIQVVVSLLAIGFVPAVIAAWIFEWTPQGLRRDSEVVPAESIAPQTGRKLDRIIIVALSLALVYFAIDKFVFDGTRPYDNSIAVLAFEDLSPEGDQEYFSDGISEELLNLLTEIPGLRVAGRTSSFSFKNKDDTIAEIGEQLNVAHVLEGSVRKFGNKIRVTTQLIEARTDTHLWSQTFDRELGDVFAIQDEIAATVVNKLKVTILGAAPESRKTNPKTYELYLQARHIWRSQQGSMKDAEEMLIRALELDPDYVPAWSQLAVTYFDLTGDDPHRKYNYEEGVALNKWALQKALEIDPEDGVANAYMGWVTFVYEDDQASSEMHIARALANAPDDSEVLRAVGTLARIIGRLDDAITLAQMSYDRDPICASCLYNLAQAYQYAGRFEEAEVTFRRRMKISQGGWYSIGTMLIMQNKPLEARQAFEAYIKPMGPASVNFPYELESSALVYYTLGQQKEFEATRQELVDTWSDREPMQVARLLAWTSDADAVFEYMDRELDPTAINFKYNFSSFMWNPLLQKLRDDPRFLAWREKAGLSEQRLATFKLDIPQQ